MAWHMGHPLSQTLFTSLYIDKLLSTAPRDVNNLSFYDDAEEYGDSVVLDALLAYCLAVIKTCSHVNNRVKSEHIYEVSQLEISH